MTANAADLQPWERITSRYPRPHTVYWTTVLPDGRRLSVARRYPHGGDVIVPGLSWDWRVRSAPNGRGKTAVIASGEARTVAAGKKAAASAARSHND